MIHIFHGFLGSPADFSFLAQDNVVIHDLYKDVASIEIHENDTLIGYSMGGRFALELAHKASFKIKKLVLINAHPGLSTTEERANRTLFEDRVIDSLKTKSCQDFLDEWNAIPIFEHDQPISINDDRFKSSPEIFNRYRLSNQKDHLPEIIQHKEKVLYIVGLHDEKYMDLASNYLLPHDIEVKGIEGGHRLFQRAVELKQVLNEEGIL